MGQFYTTVAVDFNGTDEEERQFKKLIALMNKDEDYEEEDFEELPIEIEDIVQHAMLGKLEDRGEDSGYYCRYFPDFDLTLAPKLFAALFPNAKFSVEMRWEYSVGGGETIFFADYENNELTIRQCQTEEDIEKLNEELQNQYEEGELDLVDLEEELLAVNGIKKLKPGRDADYEKSFYEGNDLLVYLESDEDEEDEE